MLSLPASWSAACDRGKMRLPGFLVVLVLACLAAMLSAQYAGPVMLYGLLFGLAANRLSQLATLLPGINLAAIQILRLGVALLGSRIVLGDVAALGWLTIVWVLAGVLVCLIFGSMLARACRMSTQFAVLSAGAVAICGASAALAIAAVLPRREDSDRQLLLVVVAVTALSTLAMIVYPLLVQWLALDDQQAGIFIGASIHDVAQVMGAGYTVSEATGDTAALVKLMRVACLVPVVFGLNLLWRNAETVTTNASDKRKPALLPWFLLAFVALMLLNSLLPLPVLLLDSMQSMSRWCLLLAVTALGVKTQWTDLLTLGYRPVVVLCAQTLLLALFALAGILLVLT